MHLIPKNNLLVIKEPPRELQTKMGIVLPDIANARDDEQVAQGEVLFSDVEEYKPGMMIMFHKVLPIDAEIEMNNEQFRIWFLKREDVLAIIEK